MPDLNKFRKLRDIGYRINGCAMCIHGDFRGGTDWGTCDKHTYQHAKHTGGPRGVSIVRFGSCGDFSAEPGHLLGAHAEFLET